MLCLEKALQRAFDRCNLIGVDCDVYSVLFSYKSIASLPIETIDLIYDDFVERLGF